MLLGRFALCLAWLACLFTPLTSFSFRKPCAVTWHPKEQLGRSQRIGVNLTPDENDTDVTPPPDDTPTTANDDDGVATATQKMNKKIVGRKKRVKGGYRLVTFGYLVFSGLFLRNGGFTALSAYSVSGPLLTAGVAHVLLGAAQHDRLSSDTYKRLNLATAFAGFVSCVAACMIPREKRMAIWLAWFLPSLVALINSIKGYGYGLKGWKLEPTSAKDDLTKGFQTTVQSMLTLPRNLQAAGYQGATLFVGTLQLWKLYHVVQTMATPDASWNLIGSRLLRYAKLSLLTTVTFTLKDAADRGRLTGSTFVKLQFLVALVFGSMAAYYKSLGSTGLYMVAAAFGLFGAATGIASQAFQTQKTSTS